MKKIIFSLITILSLGNNWKENSSYAQNIWSIAGTGALGYNGDGIPASAASFSYPAGVAVDGAGNIYITDMNNCRLRKINKSTGIITTVAGNGVPGFSGDGGPASAAQLSNYVIGVTIDGAGNLYIADGSDNCIRKINLSTNIITTIAGTGSFSGGYSGDGGLAVSSQLNYPVAVAVSSTGYIYIADCYNHRVRKINTSTGVITTAAGTGAIGATGDGGLATAAKLNYPAGVACDAPGNVYISDNGNNKIRKINAVTGIISTIAGTGAAGSTGDGGAANVAKLQNPQGIILDGVGDIYFADGLNYRIRKITVSTGIISKIAGTTMGYSGDGGPAATAQLNNANGLTLDAAGNMYLADAANQRIRKVVPSPSLPVELLSFTGRTEDKIIVLEWTTASEINNDYFDVERSSDANFFEKIGTVDGNGNSTQNLNYSFDDIYPLKGIHFYRLKQVDYDGTIDYLPTISIKNSFKGEADYFVSTSGDGKYLLHCNGQQKGVVEICDVQGKLLDELKFNISDSEIEINLDKYANGLFIIKCLGIKNSKSIMLVKN